MSGQKIKKRWKHIRDYFISIRNRLPPSGAAYEEAAAGIKWPLFRSVEFLQVVIPVRG